MNFNTIFGDIKINRELVKKSFEVSEYTAGADWISLSSKEDESQIIAKFTFTTEPDDEGLAVLSTISELYISVIIGGVETLIKCETDLNLQYGLEDIIDNYLIDEIAKNLAIDAENQKVEAYINRHGD